MLTRFDAIAVSAGRSARGGLAPPPTQLALLLPFPSTIDATHSIAALRLLR